MFIEKIQEFLLKRIPFVIVRILETNSIKLPLGTWLIITCDQIIGKYPNYTSELAEKAKKVYQQGSSETQEIIFGKDRILACFEYMQGSPTLIIVGAGHIAVPLYNIAHTLGFRIIVLDDREEFANKNRFPQANQILVMDFVEGLKQLHLDESTYITLITRGHVYDRDCLKIILSHKVAYIGMICSLRRKTATFELLQKEGYSKDILEQIFAPIGLPIGGETPEEIAVSIISEIVALQNRGAGWVWKIKKGELANA